MGSLFSCFLKLKKRKVANEVPIGDTTVGPEVLNLVDNPQHFVASTTSKANPTSTDNDIGDNYVISSDVSSPTSHDPIADPIVFSDARRASTTQLTANRAAVSKPTISTGQKASLESTTTAKAVRSSSKPLNKDHDGAPKTNKPSKRSRALDIGILVSRFTGAIAGAVPLLGPLQSACEIVEMVLDTTKARTRIHTKTSLLIML